MREADLKGSSGRAWHSRWREHPLAQKPNGTIDAWLVHRPHAHPAWAFWNVICVHLRPIEGMPPAKKHYAEAEYEILIIALEPLEPGALPDPDGVNRHLTPVDAAVQFHGVNDAQAAHIVELCVRAIVDGHISPDQDHRRVWQRVIPATAACIASGKHTPS